MMTMARLHPVSARTRVPLFLIKSYYAQKRNHTINRRVNVRFETSKFIVKTIESTLEFAEVLKLRRKVFHREYAGKFFSFRSDRDQYDRDADFLAVIDKRTSRIVGTYRLILSDSGGPFYSETEFDLEHFLMMPGKKVELSRACISPEYRHGIVIALLWKGLVSYMMESQVDYLFGLSSIKTMDPEAICGIYRKLAECKATTGKYKINTLVTHAMPELRKCLTGSCAHDDVDAEVPGLLQAYLRAGAQVVAEPAVDRKFRCIDFLTVMPTASLAKSYARRFAP